MLPCVTAAAVLNPSSSATTRELPEHGAMGSMEVCTVLSHHTPREVSQDLNLG